MKKLSTFLLLIVGFLFVGMFMPNTYATGNVTLNLKVVTKNGSSTVITTTPFTMPFGSTTTLNLGELLGEGESAIFVHNDQFTEPTDTFLMSASLNLSIIVKSDIQDYVAVFVDTNGELVDVVYNPTNEPSTSVSLTKPGFNPATFDTAVISEDTIFIAEYIKSNEASISVTINGGTKDLADPKFNDIVTVTSTTPEFSHWVDEFGFVVSYDETFKFTALNSITLTAMTNGGVPTPNIYLRDVSGIRENQESFYAKIYLPEGYELIEWGFIGSNTNENGQYQPTLTGENVSLNPNKSLNPATSEFLTTITGDGFAYTRAYATVYNNTTELYETIYSLVRNKILIDFQINYSWLHEFGDFSVLGAYVRGDFNGWSLDDKMNHSNEGGKSVYKIRKPFIFIGSEMIQDFKYFIFVPLGWNTNDGWSYDESVSTSFKFRWYHVGNNITMTINPEDGTIQNAAQSPFNHY